MNNMELDLFNDDEAPSIMGLPEEIRGKIFNALPQSEVLTLRLVCKRWNIDVDNYYNFDIKRLDETSPYFQNIIQLRVKNLQIFKLQATSVLKPDGNLIFKYQMLIRGLKILNQGIAHFINTSAQLSYVSSENIMLLLEHCEKNLRNLSMDLYPSVCTYQYAANRTSFMFENLTTLEINIEGRFEIGNNSNSLFQMLENSSMPKLKSFKIKSLSTRFTEQTNTRVALHILRLIVKNRRCLETLHIDIGHGSEFNHEILPLSRNELELLESLDNLKDICINIKSLGAATTEFWQKLISTQKQLVHVQVCKKQPLSPMPIQFLQNVVINNFASLVSINIHTLSLIRSEPAFDMSVFKICINLKSLELERNASEARAEYNPDIRNLNSLGENISKLSLNNFKISSHELLEAFNDSTTKLRKLHEVTLFNCGREKMFGVTKIVLEKLMKRERCALTDIYIYKGLNYLDEMEHGRLRHLRLSNLQDFDVDTFGLGLKRQSSNDAWTRYEKRDLFL